MRIACVNQDAGISPERAKGAAVHLGAMRRAFVARGAEVVALDLVDDRELEAALEAAGPLDLIYERYALGRSATARYAREHGIPLVLEANSPLADEASRYRGATPSKREEEHDRVTFSTARLVLAVTQLVGEYAVRRGAKSSRVEVTPNAVDPELFKPRRTDDPLRKKLAPSDRLVLGFHGRLRPWHGFDLLADATARLLESGIDVHLLLVGGGDFEAAYDGRIPLDHITRLDWVPHEQVAKWVACMDVLPLTYSADAPCYFSPLKLAEAMACGVVAVAPKLGELPARLEHGRAGLLYEPGDANMLVEHLTRLAEQPQLRRSYAQEAVKSARKHTWNDVADRVLGAFGLIPARETS